MSGMLDLNTALATYPTLSQHGAHVSRSDRYRVITTGDVLASLSAEGFGIASVTEMRTRLEARRGYQKHVVRLRPIGAPNTGEGVPEVVLMNSHDGSAGYVLFAGFLRFICDNGLIFGESFATRRVRHSGDVAAKVIDATYSVVSDFTAISDNVEAMRGVTLSRDDRAEFATRALALRYPEADKAPVTPEALLMARRCADMGADLWTTFNVVQENLTRGGVAQFSQGGDGRWRRRSVRRITGIDANISINRAVHGLATEFLRRAP